MELLNDVAKTAWMVGIQLGVPVVVLFFLGYRNQQRTRHLPGPTASRRRSGSSSASRMPAEPDVNRACLHTKECPLDHIDSYTAYRIQDPPCWQAMKASTGRLRHECVGCEKFLGIPTSY